MVVKIKGFKAKIGKILLLIKSFYVSQGPKLTYLWQFLGVVIIYGLLINFALSVFIKVISFNFKNLIASGVLFYFLKEEIPRIIVKSRVHTEK